jgi:hypothetical protein
VVTLNITVFANANTDSTKANEFVIQAMDCLPFSVIIASGNFKAIIFFKDQAPDLNVAIFTHYGL